MAMIRETETITTDSRTDFFVDEFSGPAWPDRFGDWIQSWSQKVLTKPIRTLSLFTGAGGLDIGFHQAGFHACEMVEFDSRFIPTLEKNAGLRGLFQEAKATHADVRQFNADHLETVDFIIGGPPCQSFSAAGRRAGGVQGTLDERGQLFLAYVELLETLTPVGFLFENVYGITGANGGRDWDDIQRSFRSAGYQIYHRVLDTADYGVPQHRERMFIVGLREGEYQFPRPTHGPDSTDQVSFYDAQTSIHESPTLESPSPNSLNGRYGHLLAEVPPGLNYSFFTERMGHPQPFFAWRSKFSDFLYKADPQRPVRTIKAQGGQYTGPFHWDNRPFTTAELKRLQTFPDDYTIMGGRSSVIQQIGNSVPPQMARVLALSILEQVFGVTSPINLGRLEDNEKLGFRRRKRLLTSHYEQIAKEYIERRVPTKSEVIPPRSLCVRLTEGFGISENLDGADQVYKVHFQPQQERWRFSVSAANDQTTNRGFTIDLKPRISDGWQLPCEVVTLEGYDLSASIFTIVWKAFELELQRHRLKADLVQFAGYYQYASAFTAEMGLRGRVPWLWRALALAVQGRGLRETLPAPIIAKDWEIKTDRIPEFAEFLRSLGMEIRNHHTNPQIPVGHWMLPYAFPSLNAQSVQLKKGLGV